MRSYVVVAPGWATNSAGTRCLYLLCDHLNRRGFSAFVCPALKPIAELGKETTPRKPPIDLRAPFASDAEAFTLVRDGAVAVYPCVVRGNPLKAGVVARWALGKPGISSGDATYDPRELVFYYSDVFERHVRSSSKHKLYLPIVEEDIFFPPDDDSGRHLDCVYAGKSRWRDGLFERSSVVEITPEKPRRRDLGDLFRATRWLWCFDNSTILVHEARICGARVVVVPDGTVTWRDYQRDELGVSGVIWHGVAEGGADLDPAEIHQRLAHLREEYVVQLDRFVQLTQEAKPCSTS